MDSTSLVLEVGDVLRLKSGGPWMAVVSIGPQTARCSWLDGKECSFVDFPTVTLDRYQDLD